MLYVESKRKREIKFRRDLSISISIGIFYPINTNKIKIYPNDIN